MVRYFLDAEFNGFGGQLISIALVPEDPKAAPFYEALPCPAPEPWTAAHVIPVLAKTPISREAMTAKLGEFLRADPDPVITGDWPEDIAHLALLMLTGPGARIPADRIVFELLDLPLFNSETASQVPHNACHDAAALRDYVRAEEHLTWRDLPGAAEPNAP